MAAKKKTPQDGQTKPKGKPGIATHDCSSRNEREDIVTDPQNRVLDSLAANPQHAAPSVTKKDLKAILLDTDGWMMLRGRMWDLHSKHLGAGIYRLSLKERT